MKILVTGSKGFIGQNMVLALRAAGHEVDEFDIIDHTEHYERLGYLYMPHVKGYDWVIHHGAISSTTEQDVDKVLKHNTEYSIALLNHCDLHGVNFQYSSSASVYGLNTDFKEDAPKDLRSPYAWSKYLFDRHVASKYPIVFPGRDFNGNLFRKEIAVQGFRYFNVYGPHEDHKGNMASPYHKFTREALEKGTVTIFEDSYNYRRDFVPVELVVSTHMKFFNVKETGVWNVGTGAAKSFATVAREIATKHNAQIKYIPMPENLKQHYQVYTQSDNTKINRTLHAAGLS
jgi:ADP-L-glycero-D-manno-heptose 6-epimerase